MWVEACDVLRSYFAFSNHHILCLSFHAHRCRIWDTWTVEWIIRSKLSAQSLLCAKIWGFDIRKSFHCASHWNQLIWRKITPIYQKRNFLWSRMAMRQEISFTQLRIPTHSSRLQRQVFMAAAVASTDQRTVDRFRVHRYNIHTIRPTNQLCRVHQSALPQV